ncbi:MAG: hypothetical protein LWW83_04560 [Azonexaceae bacterium]|nr:hypothetical protein [Azonexaceae bacterium]
MTTEFPTVKNQLFASGMHKGLHAQVAIALALLAGIFLLIPSWSPYSLVVFCLASAVGLLGEVVCSVRTGELTARKGKHGPFVSIRREDHPGYFWFHVLCFALLGSFCLAISIVVVVVHIVNWA